MDVTTINGKEYEVVDTLEYITLADSFVKNKIGTGHGEAKLYIGNESEKLLGFWEDFSYPCFFLKKDFLEFLHDAQNEFEDPQQDYVKKDEMREIYDQLLFAVNQFSSDLLTFNVYRVDVEPPRVYINGRSLFYDTMRNLGLPNISYLSVLKIKDPSSKAVFFYFKMFIDYKSDLVSYVFKNEQEQEDRIENDKTLSTKVKNTLINSRIGQGDYRKKLLEECPYCPFTMVSDERLLVASHIKPWALSDDKEKVDPKNGFLFTPTFDRLFDRGFITFYEDKTLAVSPWISPMNQKKLGIYNGKIIDKLPLDEKRKKYLEFHREYIFKY